LFGFSIVRLLFGGLFGSRPKQSKGNTNQQNTNTKQSQKTTPSHSKKIIDANEGEYIEYEEIKD
jgi:FtsZ-interacting cell division protein ZipA